jgi:pyruvate/2-oxoglutarate/acetoin dehydrogenase E1 component
MCWRACGKAFVTATEPQFPISALVARFIERLTGLSPADWESIQEGMSVTGTQVEMLEASRNAAVALAVRDLISRDQFDVLYAPFLVAIPIESLEGSPTLD